MKLVNFRSSDPGIVRSSQTIISFPVQVSV
jgi:hypothetical protein